MPAAPENLVATVLEWEVSASPPNLCVQLTPGVPLPIPPEPLQALRFSLLFWPCLGGVPEMQENTVDEVAAQVDDAASALASVPCLWMRLLAWLLAHPLMRSM